MCRGIFGILDGKEQREHGGRGRETIGEILGNHEIQGGHDSMHVLKGENMDFRSLRNMMVLLIEELERCIVRIGEGQGVNGPESVVGQPKGVLDELKSKPIGRGSIFAAQVPKHLTR